MTQPSNVQPITTKTVEIPEPGFPMVTRVISNPLFPPAKPSPTPKDEPMTWIVGQDHPLVPEMRVMRMFVDPGGIEVYAVSKDGRSGIRNLIPMSTVRLVEEAMPLDVFIVELSAAEGGDDEETDDDEEPEEQPGQPAPAPTATTTPTVSTNGQVAPS